MKYGDKGEEVAALQKLMRARGYDVGAIDGDFGPKLLRAIVAHACDTRTSTDETSWREVCRHAMSSLSWAQPAAPLPAPAAPKEDSWLAIAQGEIGQKEIKGSADNDRIRAYHAATSMGAAADAVPWCASFVCWCLEEAGVPSTRSARARSYEQWGHKLKPAEVGPGAIAVFWRGKTKAEGKGHIGFYVGGNPTGAAVSILGGNQSDSVKIGVYKTNQLLGFYWPEGRPLPAKETIALAHAMDPGAAEKARWA